MIRVRAEAGKSISSAAEENKWYIRFRVKKIKKKEGVVVVELDQFKFTLNSYAQPLTELRDSL